MLILLKVPIFVAHMFAFYFACLSLITPSVAITSYAAAGIAKANVSQAGWLAFRLGLPAYVVPFMFVYGQSLLLVGSADEVVITVITAMAGVSLLAVFNVGYLLQKISWPERIIALAGALLLIAPSVKTAIYGVLIGALLIIIGILRKKGKTEKNKAEVHKKNHVV